MQVTAFAADHPLLLVLLTPLAPLLVAFSPLLLLLAFFWPSKKASDEGIPISFTAGVLLSAQPLPSSSCAWLTRSVPSPGPEILEQPPTRQQELSASVEQDAPARPASQQADAAPAAAQASSTPAGVTDSSPSPAAADSSVRPTAAPVTGGAAVLARLR